MCDSFSSSAAKVNGNEFETRTNRKMFVRWKRKSVRQKANDLSVKMRPKLRLGFRCIILLIKWQSNWRCPSTATSTAYQ